MATYHSHAQSMKMSPSANGAEGAFACTFPAILRLDAMFVASIFVSLATLLVVRIKMVLASISMIRITQPQLYI